MSPRFRNNRDEYEMDRHGIACGGVENSVGRLTLVFTLVRFSPRRAVSSGMQMSAGCIRSYQRRLRFLRCDKETREEFERAEEKKRLPPARFVAQERTRRGSLRSLRMHLH